MVDRTMRSAVCTPKLLTYHKHESVDHSRHRGDQVWRRDDVGVHDDGNPAQAPSEYVQSKEADCIVRGNLSVSDGGTTNAVEPRSDTCV